MKFIPDLIKVEGRNFTFTMFAATYGDDLPESPGIFLLEGRTAESNYAQPRFRVLGHLDSLQDLWTSSSASEFEVDGVKWTVLYLEVEDLQDRLKYLADLAARRTPKHPAA